jgi:hypothetical protein
MVVSSNKETGKSCKGLNLASGVGGDNSHIVFDKKLPGEKRCAVLMQRPVPFLTKFSDSKEMLSHPTSTVALQMAAPVQEIMNSSSIYEAAVWKWLLTRCLFCCW